MRSVVDRNVVMRRIPVFSLRQACLDDLAFCITVTPGVCSNAVLWLSFCRFCHLQIVCNEVSVTFVCQLDCIAVRYLLNGCVQSTECVCAFVV
jgi:predicted KAP-like P-loop ATPase